MMRHTWEEYKAKAEELGLELLPNEKIQMGDLYMAWRNGEPVLLTAKRIDLDYYIIVPVENAYPYNIRECVKVKV